MRRSVSSAAIPSLISRPCACLNICLSIFLSLFPAGLSLCSQEKREGESGKDTEAHTESPRTPKL
uniref:Uncharacterized protein n=1 Tax=Astyanax mexicanus TaxID=7994 RepID=A0A8B9GYB5_ASTMX